MGGVGKAMGNFFNDALTVGTMGLVDAKKGRVYVPFSGASARAGARAIAGSSSDIYSGLSGSTGKINERRAAINKAIDSPEGRLAGQAAATASALGTGYGAGGAVGAGVGAGAGGATLGAAAGGAAATQINQAEAQSYAKEKGIADAAQAQRELEQKKKDALKAAEDAALAVQTREAEERRRRASKQAQTVLTGSYGLGSQAPVGLQTLSPAPARRSVLG